MRGYHDGTRSRYRELSNELTTEEDELLRGYYDSTRSRYRELSNDSNPLDTLGLLYRAGRPPETDVYEMGSTFPFYCIYK